MSSKNNRKGGAIGLELTGKIYMIWWDKQFEKKCRENQVSPIINERYMDNSNLLSRSIKPGWTYSGNKIITDKELKEKEKDKNQDELMMKLMREIGNSIHESMQLMADYPLNNPDNKIPKLNLKVWTESDDENNSTKVLYEHYRKEVSPRSTVH